MDKEKIGSAGEGATTMMMEPAVVPTDLQPSPPSKAASVHSGEQLDAEKKYETIQTIKMNDAKDNGHHMKSTAMEKPISIMNSSLNLLSNQELPHETATASSRRGIAAHTKLGLIQLVLSVLLSAFGGLLIARNASLSMMGSGIWAGIFAGVCGALGLMNIKPLLNGFLACSLISVATSTLALALTGIGLVRDYNISQQDPEFESAVMAACGLTILLILHLLTSMFSVYYSALELCSKERTYDAAETAMNYEKVQKYLKSLQAAGVSNYDLNGYQNYINNAKLHRQRSMMSAPPPPPSSHHPHHHHHHQHPPMPPYHVPIYAAPPSVSSGYLANARMYTMPHSYQSNFYQDYYYTQDEKRSPRGDMGERNKRQRKKSRDEIDEANLSYTGADRELADSYLKSMEHRDQHL